MLTAALRDNKTIIQLDLTQNQINFSRNRLEDFLRLGKISVEQRIIKLSVDEIDKIIDGFINNLANNKTLRSLNLSNNSIDNTDTKVLAEALKHNKALTKLILHKSYLKDAAIVELTQGLKENNTLKYIDLSGNPISDIGAQALLELVEYNHRITEIVLSGTQIKRNDLRKIEKALRNNKESLLIKQQDQFIQVMLILAYDTANPNSQSLYHRLPKELIL